MVQEDGALSAGDRFGRIENILARIEGKLDTKVDRADMEPIVSRVSALEAGETPLAKAFVGQFEQMQQQVADLILHGSTQAKDATRRLTVMEEHLDGLEKHREAMNARELLRDQNSSKAFRTWTLVFTALGTLAVVLSVSATLLATHH